MAARNSGIARSEVIARLIAAIPFNYLLTSLVTALLARLLWLGFGVDAANASAASTLASFAIFAVLALIAFGMRSVGKLWLGMSIAAAACAGALWLSFLTGGRL